MTSIRWKIWELASWLAWWLCPDKEALGLIMKHGYVVGRIAMDQVKAERAAKEGK